MTSHQKAKRRADEHLREQGGGLRASGASRSARYGVWVVAYRDPAEPDAALDGGALVVTDEGAVHDMGSVPAALDDLMMALGRWPGADPADVFHTGVANPEADAEATGVADFAAWAEAKRI